MREPKFRAWDKVTERYYAVDSLAYDDDGNLCEVYLAGIQINESNPNANVRLPNEVVLEQYTGLKDKNGKEIYEGDIVNAVGIGIAQVIDSPSGEWMLYYKREPDEIKNGFVCVVPKNKPSGLWKTTLTSYIEIAGNIHENPELLEDEE